jgi:glycerol-3-phosphate dehydrogenase
VFGGKITTFRRLAEHALDRLAPFFPDAGPAWTRAAVLPGGDLPDGDAARFAAGLARAHPWLPAALARRLAGSYGTEARVLLGDAARLEDLGVGFGGGLTAREVDFLVEREWALEPDDILWRRTKLGLAIDDAGIARLRLYLAAKTAAHVTAIPPSPTLPLKGEGVTLCRVKDPAPSPLEGEGWDEGSHQRDGLSIA